MGKKKKEETKDEPAEDKPPSSKKAKVEHVLEGKSEEEVLPNEDNTVAQSIFYFQGTKDGGGKKLQLLVSAFNSQQLDQYEIFRRSTFQKSNVRKLMQSIVGGSVSQNVVIAMAGMAKVYVGEIVEAACQARDNRNEGGPLRPKHIRESVRKIKTEK
ncbi:transcription initiation factor TFIID subunit 11-like [Gigantopelta aegis]|uniref:transcription initiation factor TFIID subunit 11-like n=1 Tax=Gigantopelta aegis TaxID=1735272 RepID=UPI001B88CDEA|nr:transcription initiation factor TFIID subunit 11-like [Gigantopelta aegis]